MNKHSKIFVAGHKGTLGSAIVAELNELGYHNVITKNRSELDLLNQNDVEHFFKSQDIEYVFLAAAKLDTLGLFTPADVIYENSTLQNNIIHSAYKYNVRKLVFYGSAWAYPQNSQNPIKESELLNGDLADNAVAYGIPKILGSVMCEAYNQQYNTNFLVLYLANLYGKTADFDLTTAKVLPALLRKFHLAKLLENDDFDAVLKDIGTDDKNVALEFLKNFGISKNSVEIWGSGNVIREFIHSKDLANASIFAMNNIDFNDIKENRKSHLNVGSGEYLSIKELALLIKKIVGFGGETIFNSDRPDSPMHRYLDSSRIQSFGWNSKISLEKGVKEMYNWYKNSVGGGG